MKRTPPAHAADQLSPGVLSPPSAQDGDLAAEPLTTEPAAQSTHPVPPASSEDFDLKATMVPLPNGECALELVFDQRTYDELRYMQSLLGDNSDSVDLERLISLALKALIEELE